MSSIYFLKNNDQQIKFNVDIGTIGNAGTAAKKLRTGNNIQFVANSKPEDNGDIKITELGISSDLIGSVLVIVTVIKLGKNDNIDQVFENLFMATSLEGGIDGKQTYQISHSEKTKFSDSKLIVASKAIKLQTQ